MSPPRPRQRCLLLLVLILLSVPTAGQDLYTYKSKSDDEDSAASKSKPKSSSKMRAGPPGLSKSTSSKTSPPPSSTSPPPPPPLPQPPQSAMEQELERARLASEARKRSASAEAARKEDEEKEAMRAGRRLKREAAWEQELKAMKKNERQEAIRRRKNDKKVIDKVLKSKSAYETLSLKPKWYEVWKKEGVGVSVKQVKKAYRNMAKRIHPDKNKDSRAEDAFDMLQEAYEILSVPESKKAYDRKLNLQKQSTREDQLSNAQDMAVNAFERSRLMTKIVSTLLGPFAPSFFMLCALII
ncbi:hypothetical protein TrST_g2298 [Triparma strigata]|uniref:J domain-containing protein n=1 Tax=Triparma strigata TaxID=1606541 RepID=A0A9W7AIX9_9STRA|nr:hypothetical protein TrST_g2298 [Triparma strigata]